MTLVYAVPALRKMIVYLEDFCTAGPVLVEAGTNISWPDGAEVKTLKRSIQRDYSYYTDKIPYKYAAHAEENPLDVKEFCWGEFAINGGPQLTVSTVDLLPSDIASTISPGAGLSTGVNIPPMLTLAVQFQERGAGGGPKPGDHGL